MLKPNSRVAVIGSGISSLSYTYFLSRLRPDLHITIYESSSRPSGYINSSIITKSNNDGNQDLVLEKGPRTLRTAQSSYGTFIILDILKQLKNLQHVKYIDSENISNKKYLLSNDGLLELPSGFKTFTSFLQNHLSDGLIRSVVSEIFQPADKSNNDESIDDFITRRFGTNDLSMNLISAVYHGVYAGDVKRLSVKSTGLSSLKQMEIESGSIWKNVIGRLFKKSVQPTPNTLVQSYEKSFDTDILQYQELFKQKKIKMILLDHGLEKLTSSIYDALKLKPNVIFKLNEPIKKIQKGDNKSIVLNDRAEYEFVRSTINVHNLLSTFDTNSKVITNIQESLRYVDIGLVNVWINKNLLKYNGFGYLVPQSVTNDENLLGVIFDSEVERHSKYLFDSNQKNQLINDDNYTKLTLMFGGHYWFKSSDESKTHSAIISTVKTVLQRDLDIDLDSLNVKYINETDKTIDESKYDALIDYKLINQCLPQFNVGYQDLNDQFHDFIRDEFNGSLSHGGMTFGIGCGVPDVVLNSFEDALKVV